MSASVGEASIESGVPGGRTRDMGGQFDPLRLGKLPKSVVIVGLIIQQMSVVSRRRVQSELIHNIR